MASKYLGYKWWKWSGSCVRIVNGEAMKDVLIMRVFHHIKKRRKELQNGKIRQSEIVEIPDNK